LYLTYFSSHKRENAIFAGEVGCKASALEKEASATPYTTCLKSRRKLMNVRKIIGWGCLVVMASVLIEVGIRAIVQNESASAIRVSIIELAVIVLLPVIGMALLVTRR
jgi:hypothetical protein